MKPLFFTWIFINMFLVFFLVFIHLTKSSSSYHSSCPDCQNLGSFTYSFLNITDVHRGFPPKTQLNDTLISKTLNTSVSSLLDYNRTSGGSLTNSNCNVLNSFSGANNLSIHQNTITVMKCKKPNISDVCKKNYNLIIVIPPNCMVVDVPHNYTLHKYGYLFYMIYPAVTKDKNNHPMIIIAGISCGIAGIILLVMVLGRRKRLHDIQKSTDHQIELSLSIYGRLAPKKYKFSEIKKMTKSFIEKLGQGGYGSVYKGKLPTGELVAVKLLAGAQGDGEDFINEVASIINTSHVNVVTLLGFCFEGKKRALMYEFMPNGSLDKFLHGDGSHLDWNTLFQIVKGIARGLEYLHKGCKTRIVHFDIKPHNILLDEEFVPKISDFGLAKLCKRKESTVSVTGARGTAGYMAPEVFFRSFGGASHKSDVYSYGMMVLEMTGARKNKNTANLTSASEAYFPEWIYKQVEAGDSLGVDGVTTKEDEELARKLVTVSLWCIQSDPSDRPSISKVVEMLEGNSETLQVPPKRFWSFPTMLAQGPSPSATQSSNDDTVSEVN